MPSLALSPERYTCASVSYKFASVPVLSKLQKSDPSSVSLRYMQLSSAREAVVLQTCNRFEVYTYSDDPSLTSRKLGELLASEAGLERVVVCTGMDSARHLFRVASSLDSMIVGEQEVLGQVSEALDAALSSGAAGPMLKLLFERAVRTGRRVRMETGISRGPVSIARIAVSEALRDLDPRKIRVVVVGAGRVGTMLAKYLRDAGISMATIVNRTVEKAERLALELGFEYAGLDRLPGLLRSADLVFIATSASTRLLTRGMLPARHMIIFDLSTHGNVDPGIAQSVGITLKTIDDLRDVADENRRRRFAEAVKAGKIIEEELEALERSLAALAANEVLAPIMERAERIRRTELSRAIRLLDCDDRGVEVLDAMSRAMMNKIMAPLIETVKRAAAEGELSLVEALKRSLDGS